MINRDYVKKILSLIVDSGNFEEFQKLVTSNFCYEFIGTQPYSGQWKGADAVKRQFEVFNENFTTQFKVKVMETYVDTEQKTAAVRLQSFPLTDIGGGHYHQYCAWFVYFTEDGKIKKIVDYSDTKLVNEMILRVERAKMEKLQ